MLADLFDATLRLAFGFAGASTVTAGRANCATATLLVQSVAMIESALAAESHAIFLYDFDTRIPQPCTCAVSQQHSFLRAPAGIGKQPNGS
jgi:hypothetical protein